MAIRVGINGLGRIGRNYLRLALNNAGIQVVAVNDLTPIDTNIHLMKYDSILGSSGLGNVEKRDENTIVADGSIIKFFQERDPENIPWGELGVDVVIESTGVFTTREGAQKHIMAGAKKVIISAPATNPDLTVVIGVNDHLYDATSHHIVSNASCTTNCIAPVLKALDKRFGVVQGTMTTVHAYTNDQNVLDVAHSDLRRARAAGINMIPTTTGAAKAVGLVLPNLDGKIDGYAIRVPVANGSLADLSLILNEEVTVEEVNAELKRIAETSKRKVIAYTSDPIVSTDIIGNPNSAVVDSLLTQANGRLVKVVLWYDNEWGYSNRLISLTNLMF